MELNKIIKLKQCEQWVMVMIMLKSKPFKKMKLKKEVLTHREKMWYGTEPRDWKKKKDLWRRSHN